MQPPNGPLLFTESEVARIPRLRLLIVQEAREHFKQSIVIKSIVDTNKAENIYSDWMQKMNDNRLDYDELRNTEFDSGREKAVPKDT